MGAEEEGAVVGDVVGPPVGAVVGLVGELVGVIVGVIVGADMTHANTASQITPPTQSHRACLSPDPNAEPNSILRTTLCIHVKGDIITLDYMFLINVIE